MLASSISSEASSGENRLFARGLIFGIMVIGFNTLMLHLTMRYFLINITKFSTLSFVLLYVLRYAILGILVYLFLTRDWGSPLGLIVGITVGLVVFLVVRRRT